MGADCQKILVEALEQALSEGTDWRTVDAALQGLCGTSETLHQDENVYTPKLFACLEHLPNHPHVLRTALHTVGDYAEWLNRHPEYLEQVVSKETQKDNNASVLLAVFGNHEE